MLWIPAFLVEERRDSCDVPSLINRIKARFYDVDRFEGGDFR